MISKSRLGSFYNIFIVITVYMCVPVYVCAYGLYVWVYVYMCACVCMVCECGHLSAPAIVWRSENDY